ncbi:uncharacterized protein BDW47DRAFT_104965 [Aspergillus candidus]|uniref:CBF1-interacting co-repressor CIR N-terminal domain-containing protein n=1 Tax=Aspergillus candidus TaxID=41067 RepID=A0A2I2FD25_ASPCN|nr:hypothetical protein BDW47DRAFT_104965 [Aspergillus candidus]PLB38512.1 hypothetical protein BDW47DRAFT_104965 [Aspergillus candidus]
MPLHLLGKKSWNVYNPENIARVRRDEAQAKAREEEQERRMQEVDAERRIKILRGERPPTPPPAPRSPSPVQADRQSHAEHPRRSRKRRRLAGENDTDRDIRFAREDAQLALARRTEPAGPSRASDAPLEDSTGHINLFPSEEKHGRAEKNSEAEKEAKEKERRFEDQYTMRFSNAAGFRKSVGEKPWYSSSGNNAVAPESMSSKDVWGDEDVLRGEREKARMNSNDPLAAMKKGVRQLKSVELERKKWNEERRRELEALKSEERHRSRRRRRSQSQDSLENFKLDDSPDRRASEGRSHRHHRRHRRESRERDHSRDRHSRSERHSHSERHAHSRHRHHHRRHGRNDSRHYHDAESQARHHRTREE